MSSRDVPPIETIHEGVSTVVYRCRRADDGPPVVVKQLRSDSAREEDGSRLRREYQLLASLDVPGVIRVLGLEDRGGRLAMVMEDIGGEDLGSQLGRTKLDLSQLLALASALAGTLTALHRQGVVHQAINPAHILHNMATEQVRLVGFGHAAQALRRAVSDTVPAVDDEALAYVSPEQTGRLNRPADYRTDFYSLGATLYRVLCGRHAVRSDDALGMVHGHLAVLPPAPREVDASIPETVSRIIMKLLAKMPEDRYQSGHGLRADLERCREGLSRDGVVPDFRLCREDVPEQLRIPRRLYGREREAGLLLAAFERACAGSRELLLVAGTAGIGKTALVHEIHRPILERGGYFIEGKFDALQRSTPYSAWTQAFAAFARHVLAEGDAQLARRRHAILQAVGSLGRVLTDAIPSLEVIIGDQPQVPVLEAAEAQNRFNNVFLALARAIALPENPLVVFLDDLQWIDGASIGLLQTLLGPGGVSHLMVIGAYRDNEVDDLHPLSKAVEALRLDLAPVEQLTLGDVGVRAANALIADSLHCAPERSAPLAHLLHSKTGGNPFFLRQTLTSLADKQALSFQADDRAWHWDVAAIHRMGITESVATLMVERIGQSPPETQRLLPLAACIGFRFDVSALSVVAERSAEAIVDGLQPALGEGFIASLAEGYEFVHDRIREAAYALIPAEERPRQHLRIGRLLAARTQEEAPGEGIFEIVGHLNRGAALITAPGERERLAELNLLAGRRAKASAAFAPAAELFAAGRLLLGADGWRTHYDLASALSLEQAECEYLSGDHAASETLLVEALGEVRSQRDRAWTYRLFLRLCQVSGRFHEAARIAREGLDCFGFSFPETDEDILAATDEEIRSVAANLRGRQIADLAEIPLTDDLEARALIGFLEETMPLTYVSRPLLWVLINTRGVNLCLQLGHVDESPFMYSGYAMILASVVRDIPAAIQFSEMAIELNERLPNTAAWKGKLLFHHGAVVNIWGAHLAENLPLLDEAFRASLDAGDLANAGYLTYNAIWLHFENGDRLSVVADIARGYAEFARQTRNTIVHYVDRIEEQFALCLMRRTRSETDFCDEGFDEAECVAAIDRSGFRLGTAYHHILKLVASYFAGDFEGALGWADRAAPMLLQVASMINEVTYYFYRSLAIAALHDRVSPERQRDFRAELADALDKLRYWSENCPANFSGRLALVAAEVARLEGRVLDAMRLYEESIAAARENRFVHNEAVACETAAAFYRQQGFETFARTYLAQAADCYDRWGALGKVEQLSGREPWLPQTGLSDAPTLAERVDAAAVAKAHQAISREIRLERLAETLLRIAMENAGAQRGFLSVEGSGQIWAESKGDQDGHQRVVFDASASESEFPESIVNYVRRSGETVTLSDAVSDAGPFSGDDYLRRVEPRSLLCLPVQRQARILAVLYLENDRVAGAFTREHRLVLEMLAAQAAISLETSGLYEALQESEERTRLTLREAQIGIFDWDILNDIWSASDVYYSMLGYEPNEGPADREEWLARTHPEDRPVVEAKIQDVRTGATSEYEYEARLRHADGRYRWEHVRGFAVQWDSGGRVTRMLGIRTDISARKAAEQDIELLSHALDHTREAAFLIDPRYRIVYANEGARRSLEYGREELLGMSVLDIDASATDEWIAEILASPRGRSVTFETRHRTRSGRVFPVEVSSTSVDHGDSTYILALARDIAERKQAEQELRESERRLAQAQRIAHVGYWERDFDAGTISASDEASRILGLPQDQLTIRLEHWLERWMQIIHPEDRSRTVQAATDAMAGGPPYNVVYRVVRPDGEVRVVHSEAVVTRDETGQPRSMLGMMQDITERTRAEQEIRRLNQELEHRIAARTAQLERANKELEAFAYSVSHDLRAPLRHIDGFVGMLSKQVAQTASKDAHRYMASISNAAGRMSQLIDDLLSFSRMGQAEMARDRVALAEVVQEVIGELAPDVADRDVRWRVADLPEITGDRALLRAVFANLLANALKFTRPRDPAMIEIGCETGDDDEEVVISVRDNGVGFNPEYADNLFGVFQRLHRAEDFEGTGIGLANVRRIINRHGGRTWARGAVDQGATFYFSLPKAREVG